jgi:hypothetical protein
MAAVSLKCPTCNRRNLPKKKKPDGSPLDHYHELCNKCFRKTNPWTEKSALEHIGFNPEQQEMFRNLSEGHNDLIYNLSEKKQRFLERNIGLFFKKIGYDHPCCDGCDNEECPKSRGLFCITHLGDVFVKKK